MRLLSSAVFLLTAFGPCAAFAAQAPSNPPPVPPPAQSTQTASALLQPSLDELQQALDALRPDKWKTSDDMRRETAANISSIRNDLETTLPPLLIAADKAPGSVAQVLPAYRNVEALYDVLLRVTEVADLSAPSQQSTPLEGARASLEDSRRALGEHLQSGALAQDQQLRSLQAAVRAVPAAPAPVPCTPAPPAKKRRTRRKSVKKPAPATSQKKP